MSLCNLTKCLHYRGDLINALENVSKEECVPYIMVLKGFYMYFDTVLEL